MVTAEEIFGMRFDRGEVIFSEGEPGDTMYVIQMGEVEITRRLGDEQISLAKMGRGEFFGEMSLVDNMPRSATATAVRKSRLLPLTRRSLLERAEIDPAALMQILGALSSRIEAANRFVRELAAADENLARTIGPDELEEPSPHVYDRGPSSQKREALEELGSKGVVAFNFDPDACVWFEPGQTIFRQGDPGDVMYFILDGAVDISGAFDGRTERLALLGPLDFFGEMALITNNPRTADAIAIERTHLLPINRDQFFAKVNSKPELGLFIAQVLSARLRRVASQTEGS